MGFADQFDAFMFSESLRLGLDAFSGTYLQPGGFIGAICNFMVDSQQVDHDGFVDISESAVVVTALLKEVGTPAKGGLFTNETHVYTVDKLIPSQDTSQVQCICTVKDVAQ